MKHQPPSVKGSFFWGNLRRLQKDPLGLFYEAFKEHGNIVRIKFGPGYSILLSHPDDIKYVLQTNRTNYVKQSRAYKEMRRIFGDGLLTSEDESWNQQRQYLALLFSKNNTEQLFSLMEPSIQTVLKSWEPDAKNGTPMNLFNAMCFMTIFVLGKTLLGKEMSPSEVVTIRTAMNFLSHYLMKRATHIFNLPLWVPGTENQEYHRSLKELGKIVDSIITGHHKELHQDDSLTKKVIEKNKTPRQISDQLLNFLIAGHETTAITLTWFFYFLDQYPMIEKAVVNEVLSITGDQEITLESLKKLSLTKNTLMETFRFLPPVGHLSRRSVKADTIGGYDISSNTVVIVSPYVTHRHPDFWKNPDTFDPSRYGTHEAMNLNSFAHIPFGGGPRECIANHFATQEILLAIVLILKTYKLERLSNDPITIDPTLTMTPKEPLLVKLASRQLEKSLTF